MPFKKFKEKHGGNGPFEEAYAAATGGEGLFGRLGMRDERAMTDQLIADVSGNPEFEGLAGLAEAGRGPLTREQHADFRAALTQSALDTRVANAGYQDYLTQSAALRASVKTKDDALQLDIFDTQMKHAQRLSASGDPATRQQGMSLMGTIFASTREFARANEQTNLELQSSEDAGRERIRSEIQQELNSQILAPVRQDTANYRAILAQLEGKGDEAAPNSLTSAVLEYAGAQLRASDDGNWSFQVGPLGLSDAAVPTMTFSQLRNQLNAAYKGRDEYMRSEGAAIVAEAEKRGFAVNGTRVDDILYPLANRVYAAREAESQPPAPTQENIESKAEAATNTIGSVATGVARGSGLVDVATNVLEFLAPLDEAPSAEPERLPVNGDVREQNNSRQRPGYSRGVWVPPALR